MLKDKIGVAKGFQTSINIAFDLHNDDKVRNFIPTMSSLEIIEDVLYSTSARANSRSRILIGAYGRGKSHIILVLMSLLFKKDVALFDVLLNKIKENNPTFYEFALDYINSDKKLLPIIVSGSSSSLTQSFLSALQHALKNENLSDIMPETHFMAAVNAIELWKNEYADTYNKFVAELNEPVENIIMALKEFDVYAYDTFKSLYPRLTSGSEFNPFLGFNVVELYEKVVKQLKTKGYDGVYIIYDEFSKYLESSLANATISDTKLLQDFAEKCDRSENNQMHLMLISHKDISNYIDKSLPKEKVDGWRGVSGRFKHITLHNNFSQMYEIISSVIKKEPSFWARFCSNNEKRFNELQSRFITGGILDKETATTAVYGCYPMHPLSTFILPRISEKVAQNERTLFTFLSMDSKHTLSDFIKNAEGEFPMLTPDYIYDYFEMLLRKEHYDTEIYKLYRLTSKVLNVVEPASLEAKIIKTIALIYVIEQFEKLPPTYDTILNAFDFVYEIKDIRAALSNLIDNECIVYLKRSNGYLKIKESSGVDIQKEIEKQIERTKATLSVKDILNKASFDSYMYPTAYNDENEITRYFNFTFIDSEEFLATDNWDIKMENTPAEGVIYAIIPKDKAEIPVLRKSLLSGKHDNHRAIFVIPNSYTEIDKFAYEYDAVKLLKQTASEDPLLADEYDIFIEDLEEIVSGFILSYTRPEIGGAEYYYESKKQSLKRKAQLSALLSDICRKLFAFTPIINNESINKNELPTVAINSRNKILYGLLESDLEANIGLSGTGQDVSIMRSTLIKTGILQNEGEHARLNLTPEDENMRLVLRVIKEFLTATNNKAQNFGELYKILTEPQIGFGVPYKGDTTLPSHGYGLKKGVIPIYLAVVLHNIKKHLVIRNKSGELKITVDLLNSINESPESYTVMLENWNEEKSRFIDSLVELFEPFVMEKEKDFNTFSYVTLAMNRWYLSLPQYSKETKMKYKRRGEGEKISKDYIKFIESLKMPPANAREYLFETLFKIFKYNEFTPNIVDNIKSAKATFDYAKSNLNRSLIEDVKYIFSGENKSTSSLTSLIKDWYEKLKPTTVNHLFSDNEDKVLELMKTITNDENAFIERLGKIVIGLRIDDWKQDSIKDFYEYLVTFKKTVSDFDRNAMSGAKTSSEVYKISFVSKSGDEVIKTFEKAAYSDRAKLLLNSITSEIEDMGQSISEQEKRQVLMELLEKMC